MFSKRFSLILAIFFMGILLDFSYAQAGLMFEQRTILTGQTADTEQYDMLKKQMKSVSPEVKAQMEKALKELEGSFVPETTYQTMYFENGMMKSIDKEAGAVSILRMDKDVIWHINLKDSTYMEMKLSQIKDMLGKMKEAFEKLSEEIPDSAKEEVLKEMEGDFTIKETSERKKIAGYNCQKFIVVTSNEEREVWITKDIDFTKYIGGFKDFYKDLGLERVLSKAMFKMKGFPMLTKSEDMAYEVVKVSEQKLGEKVFSLPKGLKKIEMMDMFKGLQEK